jgi:hypothetical protein
MQQQQQQQQPTKLTDIVPLRIFFYKLHLELTPKSHGCVLEQMMRHRQLFADYNGGVSVRKWTDDTPPVLEILRVFANVKSLKLSHDGGTAWNCVGMLAEVLSSLARLERLDLSGCHLGEGDLAALATIPHLARMRSIELPFASGCDEAISVLMHRFPNTSFEGGGVAQSGAIASDRSDAAMRDAEPENGISARIQYDPEAAAEVLEAIRSDSRRGEDDPVWGTAEGLLQSIDREIRTINGGVSLPSAERGLAAVRSAAESLLALLCRHDERLAVVVNRLVLNAIAGAEKEVADAKEMPATEREALERKTRRLYAEQSFLCTSERYGRGSQFSSDLASIGKLVARKRKSGSPPPRCFMSYAWHVFPEERWVQPFLYVLYDHLSFLGLTMVMDQRDNRVGDSLYSFMAQIEHCRTISFCTKSLLAKHHGDRNAGIKTELTLIDRLSSDSGGARVMRVLLSGTPRTALPEGCRDACDVRELGYIGMLRRIVDWAFGTEFAKRKFDAAWREEYDKAWSAIAESYSRLPRQQSDVDGEIAKGFHQPNDLSRLRQCVRQ